MLYWAYDYLSMLRVKQIHVGKGTLGQPEPVRSPMCIEGLLLMKPW